MAEEPQEPEQSTEPAEEPAAEEHGSEEGGAPASRGGRWLAPLALAVALAVLVSGAVAWWRAAHDEAADVAAARDGALIAARGHIETLNTLDYRDVEGGLAAWSAVTTGTLHDQLAEVAEEDRALLAAQKKISTGRVVDAAVVDLDDGSATVIAAVEITVADPDDAEAEPTVKRNRFRADVVRTGGQWKLEDLQQVAVELS